MMPPGGLLSGALGTVVSLTVSSLVLLALFIGFCVLFNFPKLRRAGRDSLVYRSLDEAMGGRQHYLPPDAPSGRADQLRTPELLEAEARKTA